MSRETFTHEQLYLNLQANLCEVFEWIEEEVSRFAFGVCVLSLTAVKFSDLSSPSRGVQGSGQAGRHRP
jgi:translation elongation factor EF-1beta